MYTIKHSSTRLLSIPQWFIRSTSSRFGELLSTLNDSIRYSPSGLNSCSVGALFRFKYKLVYVAIPQYILSVDQE